MDDIATEIRAILVEAQRQSGMLPVPVAADAIDQIVRSLGIEVIFDAYIQGHCQANDLRDLNHGQLCDAATFVKAWAHLLEDAHGVVVPIGTPSDRRPT